MHLKRNTQLQIRKWWDTLLSAFIFPLFYQTFVNTSQKTAPYIQQRKQKKDSSTFQNNNDPYINSTNIKFQTQMSLKSVSCALQESRKKKLRPNANFKNNLQEMYAYSYITFILLWIIK